MTQSEYIETAETLRKVELELYAEVIHPYGLKSAVAREALKLVIHLRCSYY